VVHRYVPLADRWEEEDDTEIDDEERTGSPVVPIDR
jgi:hypothetical protein